jgi:3D (Asp-Asp-Asp) domain-containing protein
MRQLNNVLHRATDHTATTGVGTTTLSHVTRTGSNIAGDKAVRTVATLTSVLAFNSDMDRTIRQRFITIELEFVVTHR